MDLPPSFIDEFEAIDFFKNKNNISNFEKTLVIASLIKAGYKNRKIRNVLNIASTYETTHLIRAGRLSDEEMVLWFNNQQRITLGHVRIIVSQPGSKRIDLMRELLIKRLSVQKFRNSIDENKIELDFDISSYETCISEQIGREISIKAKSNMKSGVITLSYFSNDDLEHLLSLLGYKANNY